ncbi:MAG: hypothetical protein P0Y53_01305 [Candidatus Pseudobacter hemicellulosilyticus]|uniref:Uncharacterized protein n=1 Tax=Candidatus Pseudobacter hemicellulosilyticus TaxID=3121375 RepID=A0AAJ6BHP9_9BACT|nr:MAG: hypothetical protein P0Y53_01305 [Pseudobacter sp.]
MKRITKHPSAMAERSKHATTPSVQQTNHNTDPKITNANSAFSVPPSPDQASDPTSPEKNQRKPGDFPMALMAVLVFSMIFSPLIIGRFTKSDTGTKSSVPTRPAGATGLPAESAIPVYGDTSAAPVKTPQVIP